MKNTFKFLIPSLAFAFGIVAGSCESKADLARKPGLVDTLVKQSIELCDTSYVVAENGAPYGQRLTKLLMKCNAEDLATLRDNGIVISLDRRLSQQETGFWDRSMHSVFYNNSQGKSLSIWDNGVAEGGLFSKDPSYRISETVRKLANEIRDGVPADMDVGIAYISGGKHKRVHWVSAEDFDKDTRAKNEALLRRSNRRKQDSLDSAGGSW